MFWYPVTSRRFNYFEYTFHLQYLVVDNKIWFVENTVAQHLYWVVADAARLEQSRITYFELMLKKNCKHFEERAEESGAIQLCGETIFIDLQDIYHLISQSNRIGFNATELKAHFYELAIRLWEENLLTSSPPMAKEECVCVGDNGQSNNGLLVQYLNGIRSIPIVCQKNPRRSGDVLERIFLDI